MIKPYTGALMAYAHTEYMTVPEVSIPNRSRGFFSFCVTKVSAEVKYRVRITPQFPESIPLITVPFPWSKLEEIFRRCREKMMNLLRPEISFTITNKSKLRIEKNPRSVKT